MSWIVAIVMALAAFALIILAYRIPRAGWALVLACLTFGLAGYAFQASPSYPGAPKDPRSRDIGEAGWQLVELRKELVSTRLHSNSPNLLTADAMVRQGQFANAATLLGGAVEANPNDMEAWLALGNALVEHAEGNLTPAAIQAYQKAAALAPDEPGPAMFMGFAMLREGKLIEAHQLWSETLADAPADAEWRPVVAERVLLLEQLMRQIVEARQAEQP